MSLIADDIDLSDQSREERLKGGVKEGGGEGFHSTGEFVFTTHVRQAFATGRALDPCNPDQIRIAADPRHILLSNHRFDIIACLFLFHLVCV